MKYTYNENKTITDVNGEIVYAGIPYPVGEDLAELLNERIDHTSTIVAQGQEIKRLKLASARLINDAVDIMTPEQVGQWRGVRAFLESLD